MGFSHAEYLSSHRIFGCQKCKTHLSTIESLISRRFNGQHGPAYLFDKVTSNVKFGPPDDRHMTTGLHTVRDINCLKCGVVLGWKYVSDPGWDAVGRDWQRKREMMLMESSWSLVRRVTEGRGQESGIEGGSRDRSGRIGTKCWTPSRVFGFPEFQTSVLHLKNPGIIFIREQKKILSSWGAVPSRPQWTPRSSRIPHSPFSPGSSLRSSREIQRRKIHSREELDGGRFVVNTPINVTFQASILDPFSGYTQKVQGVKCLYNSSIRLIPMNNGAKVFVNLMMGFSFYFTVSLPKSREMKLQKLRKVSNRTLNRCLCSLTQLESSVEWL